jgi:asparagine synthase (glutamine-hydrolysing)
MACGMTNGSGTRVEYDFRRHGAVYSPSPPLLLFSSTMCGIAGQVVASRAGAVDERLVRRMTRTLAHRGPDGERVRAGDQFALGHRRLSLIDLEGGGQPLANEDETIWVVSNSEIYNYVELRRDLISRGHRFATSSDTEVIVHLYEDMGRACVESMVGMFAFALWDARDRTLLLARDRFGIKPLYYALNGPTLLFASEMKGILQAESVDRDLNYAALHQYFLHLTIPEPACILRSVRKLPAAHVLVWRDGVSSEHRYWDLTDRSASDRELAEEEAMEQLDRTLRESVSITLRSDVPVGLFLSGGVDSSLLAWAASVGRDRPLHTFSIAFEDPASDERDFSRLVASTCGTTHHELELTLPQAADAAARLVSSLDEPFADSSAIPTYLLSRYARQHVKAVLTGEGADELFAGSPWHHDEPIARDDLPALLLPPAKIVFTPDDLCATYTGDLRRLVQADSAWTLPADASARLLKLTSPLDQRLWVDLCGYLPSDLLMKTDRMTMLASLEARVPFLNHPFAELAWRIPPALKVRDSIRKYILKKLGVGRIPQAILDRPKKGFSIPMDLWLWMKGSFREMIVDTLTDARTHDRGLFNPAVIQSMLNEHDRLVRFHGYRLWTLFVFETWQRHFVDSALQPAL